MRRELHSSYATSLQAALALTLTVTLALALTLTLHSSYATSLQRCGRGMLARCLAQRERARR
jgi:hypothetical protein